MNRHEMRVKVMTSIYQHLLTGADIFDSLANNVGKETDPFMDLIVADVVSCKDKYVDRINALLKEWTFDRLGLIEQAILLMSISEIELEINEKPVVINEAITLAKVFGGDDDSYKLINASLDKL